ncbi:hypothetical protein GGR41_001966 [Paenalcaligenes hominis]|uniref:Uncharacterized protein n=1 Tax=Paenalcaligenes hominis TaxID=643674 RepID=A0ABX0WSK8_9BURK|nr:hypothetical protein [Paenalcaligenes hominis]
MYLSDCAENPAVQGGEDVNKRVLAYTAAG